MRHPLKTPRPPCGAVTKTCTCGHHRKAHGLNAPGAAPKYVGPCGQPGCACQAFAGRRCREDRALCQNGRCVKHGGHTATGLENAAFTNGRVSQVLPPELAVHFARARADPALLSLEDDLAVMRAMLWTVLEGLRDGTAIAEAVHGAAAAVHTAYRDAHLAHRAQNAERFADAMTRLGEADGALEGALQPAAAQKAARAEAAHLALVLERLARSENTRLVQLHNMVTAERALALQAAVVQSVVEVLDAHVPDAAVRRAIRVAAAARLGELVGRRGPAALGPGGGDGGAAAGDPAAAD